MKLFNKVVIGFIVFIMSMSAFSSFCFAESVCVLSDFEENMDGWNNNFEATAYRTTDEAHSGRFSLETTTVNDWGAPTFYYRFIPGVKYRVSVWVKVKGAPDVAQVIFDYSAYGQQQPYWGFFGTNTIVTQDEWTEISFDYIYQGGNPDGKTNIFVRIGNGQVSDFASEERKTYYIDDLKISYQNPTYNYVDTQLSSYETAVNKGFDLNTDGYVCRNARMKYVKDGANNTYGAALVMTDNASGFAGQNYLVEEGKKYIFSVWVKSPDKKIPMRLMMLEKNGTKSVSRPLSEDIIVGRDWQQLSAEFEYTQNGYSNEKILYVSGGDGVNPIKYYMDDFSVLRYDSDKEYEYKEPKISIKNPIGQIVLSNGKSIFSGEAAPYLSQNELMCQADLLAEAIGAKSEYLNGCFYIEKGVNKLQIIPYSNLACFNDKIVTQKNQPVFVNEKLVVGADFVTDLFDLEHEFIKEANVYYIDTDNLNGVLSNTIDKISKGENLTIAYFGSSFMRAGDTDYPIVNSIEDNIISWFSSNYPHIKTQLHNAEVNGTDSMLGIYRLDDDVLRYNPDLIFIDFAVNDFKNLSSKQVLSDLENIIRRIKKNNEKTDIVILNTISADMISQIDDDGIEPFVTAIYKDISSYYNVGFLDLGSKLYEDYISTGGNLTDYFIKNMQITQKTSEIYYAGIADFMSKTIKNNNNLYSYSMPVDVLGGDKVYKIKNVKEAKTDEKWELKDTSIAGAHNECTIVSDQADGEIEVEFTGDTIGLYYQVSPNAGAIEYKIDNGEWIYFDLYDEAAYKYKRPAYRILSNSLSGDKHILKIRVSRYNNKESLGNEVSIGGFLVKE